MRLLLLSPLLAAIIFSFGCATTQTKASAPPATSSARKGDPRIGVFVSDPWTFSTSSYWIEGPDGLILIDTQFLPSSRSSLARTRRCRRSQSQRP